MSGEVDWNHLVVDLRLGLLYPPSALAGSGYPFRK